MSAELRDRNIGAHPYSSVVTYGSKEIEYRLLRVARKTMEIAVHPDSTVIVKAPVQSISH